MSTTKKTKVTKKKVTKKKVTKKKVTKKKTTTKKVTKPRVVKPKLVEILRHVSGPPRRAVGQRIWLTQSQIEKQGLKEGDYKIV